MAREAPIVPPGASVYRYDAAALAVLGKRLRNRLAASSTLTLVLMSVMTWATARVPLGGWPMAIGAAAGAVTMAVISVRAYRRQLAQLRSFTLSTDDHALRRTIDGYPPVEIRFADLRRVHENARGLSAHGADRTLIGAARELPGYDALRDRLRAIRPLEPVEKGRQWAKTTALLALSIAGLVALQARDREIALVATVVTIAGQGFIGAWMWNSTQIELRTRALLRIAYPLLVLAFVVRAYHLAVGR